MHMHRSKNTNRGVKEYNEGKNLSGECLERIRQRNRLRKIAKRTRKMRDWENWKKEKNKVNNLIRNEAMNKTRREQAFAEEDLTGK